jgi:hypothetical protein
MTQSTAEKMSEAFWETYESFNGKTSDDAMRAAILTLADNVTDEMLAAFTDHQPMHYLPSIKWKEDTRKAISAALRAGAAGS